MNLEQKALRLGAAMLSVAIVLRMLSGIPNTTAQTLAHRELAQFLIFLQTGRRLESRTPEAVQIATQPPTEATEAPAEPKPPAVVFTAEDAALVQLRNTSGCAVDTAALLTQPLDWELTGDAPTVLILHSHGTESYAGTEGYRSDDESRNMLSIGDRLTALLEAGGITVLHDRTLHDADSYNGSYSHARKSIEQYLAQYPSIRLVLDIHRDAAEDENGEQIDYTVTTPDGQAAKLMLVMGTDAGGLSHPHWQDNLALAVKLYAGLEKLCPDICRPMYVRTSRFNQDLSPGALLVEVGAAGNTQQEALLATDILAQGILALAHGANT